MTGKEYLLQARRLKARIDGLEERMEELDARIKSIGAMRYDRPAVQGGTGDGALVDGLERLWEARRRLAREEARYQALCAEIEGQVDRMGNKAFSDILRMKYVEGKAIREAAEAMGYSESYMKHVHARAVRAFEETFIKKIQKKHPKAPDDVL